MDQGSVNFAENRVTKKVEGSYKTKRLLFRVGQFAFMLLPIVVGLSVFQLLLWMTPVFVLLGIKLGNVLFKRWLDIEYEYAIVAGELRVDTIYGNFRRVPMTTVRFRDMSKIAPMSDDSAKADTEASDIVNRYDPVSTMSHPNVHYGLYTDEKGDKSVIFFEVNEKMVEQIKRFNPAAKVVWTKIDNYSK